MILFAQRRRLTVGVSWFPAHWTPYFTFVRGALHVYQELRGPGPNHVPGLDPSPQMR